MRNTAVLMVCAYLQGALAAKIFAESETGKKTTKTTTSSNPCLTATLSIDPHDDDGEIELPLGEQVLIDSCIVSTPSCPYTCALEIENDDIVRSFDEHTGDLVVYNRDESLCGDEVDFKITCTSTLSGSQAHYEGFVSIPHATDPVDPDPHHQSHSSHGKNGKLNSGSHGHGNLSHGHGNSGSHHGGNPGSGH